MVPCYNEGDNELRKTISSVMDTSYPTQNKVLVIVADGNITGRGEEMSTPDVLAELLGYDTSPSDTIHKCKSIGDLSENRAKLYYGKLIWKGSHTPILRHKLQCWFVSLLILSFLLYMSIIPGTYEDAGKKLSYLVVVKCGLECEEGSPKAGNRGKRDSQLLLIGLLNRFHHGRELNELDRAVKDALDKMHFPLDEIQYLLAIDADTRIDRDSISHMCHEMNNNSRVLALCGETKVDNKAQSWVSMIQVFEYYLNHYVKKAFESAFGCVTCLPGCFTMYRLFSDDGTPLISCGGVYHEYSTNDVKSLHRKNLFLLGEDRMLTTLLLQHFPDMQLSFVPEATCFTIVP